MSAIPAAASGPRLLAAAAAGILRRDARLYFSYRLRGVMQLATIFLSLALFFYVSRLVGTARFPSPGAYFAYAVVGLAIVEVLTAAMSAVPTFVRQELLTGTFERLVVSPFGPVAGIASMALFPLALSLLTSTLTILVAGLAFGLDLQWSTVPLAIPVALLGALAFLPFALLVSAIVLVIKQAGAVTTYIVTGLSLTSGVLFPVDLLPWYVRWISEVQPLAPALDLMRHLLLGTPLLDPAGADVLRLVLFALILLPVSFLVLRATVERCRRAGTLIEY